MLWDRLIVEGRNLNRRLGKSGFLDRAFSRIRLFYLCVLCFGLGIATYFLPDYEPPEWIWLAIIGALPATLILSAGLMSLTRFVRFGAVLLLAGLFFCGFGFIKYRAENAGTVMLERELFGAPFKGCVAEIEPHRQGARLTFREVEVPWLGNGKTPSGLRLTTRQEDVFDIGDCIEGRAALLPSSGALHPDGYNFARQNYFRGIGASGFMMGDAEKIDAGGALVRGSLTEAWTRLWNGLRLDLIRSIKAYLPEDEQALVIVFLTGQKGKLTEQQQESMRQSGLAHLLAISGLHMGLLAGILFGGTRFMLALWPALALRYPIKKLSAVVAFAGCFLFLQLIGAPVPAQRAFIMIGFALGAILLDRNPFSFRLVFVAALGVMILAPEVVVSASFQLSFAAVLALVSFYQTIARADWVHRLKNAELEGRPGAVLSLLPGAVTGQVLWWLCSLFLCSLVASLATLPFVAYHFQNISLMGIPANMLAVPWTGAVVMPLVLVCLVALPLGMGEPFVRMLSWSLDQLLLIAEFFGAFSLGAVHVPPLGVEGLLLLLLIFLWLVLIEGPLRWAALLVVPFWAIRIVAQPQPVMLVDEKAKLIAFRDEESIVVSTLRSERFARNIWKDYWGSDQIIDFQKAAVTSERINCDPSGCLVHFDSPEQEEAFDVALSFSPNSLRQDCRNADLVIARYPVYRFSCEVPLFDRRVLGKTAGIALWPEDTGHSGYSITALNGKALEPSGEKRPWER
ncbi:ComEC/Rec2 family competence protein [Kiloniella sp. b19]|uniref:ComEC/Rec2 family competence protein n=1 Tax=Kiloniella sp. GXU_MW_B19 TaxID=3141326 RepID=UPI0031CE6DF8